MQRRGAVLNDRRVLLIIGGGIAAYKCLELIRRGRERGLAFRCVLTAAATQFVTPLSVASLAGEKVYEDLFSLTDEAEMGHIRLSREADLVVVAPATADLMAKMAAGLADDLASTLLLASDKPVLVAPAMNPQMWSHPATRRNLARLREDGVRFVGPNPGDMACGEVGSGRMAEPHEILAAIEGLLAPAARPLAGMRAMVTSGPTREPLDPSASCPTTRPAARAMPSRTPWPRPGRPSRSSPARCRSRTRKASRSCMWRPRARCSRRWRTRCRPRSPSVPRRWPTGGRRAAERKIKKREGEPPPAIELVENPDILRTLATHAPRPRLVIGFAAETGDLEAKGAGEAGAQGLRLDPGQRRLAGTGVFGGEPTGSCS